MRIFAAVSQVIVVLTMLGLGTVLLFHDESGAGAFLLASAVLGAFCTDWNGNG